MTRVLYSLYLAGETSISLAFVRLITLVLLLSLLLFLLFLKIQVLAIYIVAIDRHNMHLSSIRN